MTCSSTGRSRERKNSRTVSTICSTGASRVCTTGQTSAMCSTTCRTNTSCLPATSDRGAGRPPPGSSSRLKNSGWGGGGFCRRNASCSSCPSSPALAFVCVRRAEWCENAAHADGLLFVTIPRTQPPLSASLGDTTRKWSPARISHAHRLPTQKSNAQPV